MSDTIDAIKQRLGTVRDVLEEHSVQITGRKFRCIVPGHEDKHPSASLHEDNQRFKCHSCGARGDSIETWAILNGVDNAEAIRTLAEQFGLNGKRPATGSRRRKRKPKTRQEKFRADYPSTAQGMGSGPDPETLGRQVNFAWEDYKDDKGETKHRRVPRPYDETVDRLMLLGQSRLFRVQNLVFTTPDSPGDEIRNLRAAPDFIGWLGEQARTTIEWVAIPGAATKAEAFSALIPRLVPFKGIETAPHHPPMADLYYNHPELPEPDQAAFDELLEFFCPDTEADRALIAAMFLTALWGGGLGQRPAFIITSPDGRGSGKTTVPALVAHLLGQQPVESGSKQDMEKLKTRLLSEEGLTTRVVIFDNETGRVSSGELAGLITAHYISGHRMYSGEGRRPNNLLWCITLNTPSLDSDLASRGIPISIRRPDYSPDWKSTIMDHVDRHRWGIIAALLALLRMEALPPPRSTRWGAWEHDVLAKVVKWAPDHDIGVLQALIGERQREFDDEQNEIELIREALERAVRRTDQDPDLYQHFIPNNVAAHVYNEATGARVRHRTALRDIDELIRTDSTPELAKARHGEHGRGYYWSTESTPVDADIAVVRLPVEAEYRPVQCRQ